MSTCSQYRCEITRAIDHFFLQIGVRNNKNKTMAIKCCSDTLLHRINAKGRYLLLGVINKTPWTEPSVRLRSFGRMISDCLMCFITIYPRKIEHFISSTVKIMCPLKICRFSIFLVSFWGCYTMVLEFLLQFSTVIHQITSAPRAPAPSRDPRIVPASERWSQAPFWQLSSVRDKTPDPWRYGALHMLRAWMFNLGNPMP